MNSQILSWFISAKMMLDYPPNRQTLFHAALSEAARPTMSVCSLRQSRSRESSDQGSHEGHADSLFGSDHADYATDRKGHYVVAFFDYF
jgi:hypothetical protein